MSTHIKWTEDMSVGESSIDKQHQILLQHANKVVDAISHGATSKEISETIAFFDRYIKEHFSYEEGYMKKYNYPNFEEHKKEHDIFIKKYSLFKDKLNNGVEPRELAVDIDMYLGQWWIRHIGKEDKKYHAFIDSIAKKLKH